MPTWNKILKDVKLNTAYTYSTMLPAATFGNFKGSLKPTFAARGRSSLWHSRWRQTSWSLHSNLAASSQNKPSRNRLWGWTSTGSRRGSNAESTNIAKKTRVMWGRWLKHSPWAIRVANAKEPNYQMYHYTIGLLLKINWIVIGATWLLWLLMICG